MTTPGKAPSTPAFHEPYELVATPPEISWESSPKYQTFPSTSCAYQSNVSSVSDPFVGTASFTTTLRTPMIFTVSFVTVTVSVSCPYEDVPSNRNVLPGWSGKYALSIVVVKRDASISGRYG